MSVRETDATARTPSAGTSEETTGTQLPTVAWRCVRHELRAPLTNIRLYLGLLASGPIDRRDRYLEVLHAEVDRLAGMIDALGRDARDEPP